IRMPARELDRLPWDVALDPCQVPRRDLVGIARTDAELGAVVHPHGEPAGNRVPDVPVLARVRAGDRAHVRQPAPAGLEDEVADRDLVEQGELDAAARNPTRR